MKRIKEEIIKDQDVVQIGRERFVVSFPDLPTHPGRKIDKNIYLYKKENWMAGGEDGPDAILERGKDPRFVFVNSQKSYIRPFGGRLQRIGPVEKVWPEGE